MLIQDLKVEPTDIHYGFHREYLVMKKKDRPFYYSVVNMKVATGDSFLNVTKQIDVLSSKKVPSFKLVMPKA